MRYLVRAASPAAVTLGMLANGTVTDAHRIREEMERARQDGYCIVTDEYHGGGSAMAVPISDVDGHRQTAFGFACLSLRFEDKREMLLHEVLQAKSALTRMLSAAWRG
jgi:DNA-binding IclR family transcriptional regulator